MGSYTAQILVGVPHPNHGGIIPSHSLSLSENSRPAWVLVRLNPDTRNGGPRRVTWIPTHEHALEDGVLMIAIHVARDAVVLAQAMSFCSDIDGKSVDVHKALNEAQREALYENCRGLTDFPKLAVSVYEGSLIARHLQVLERYSMDVEVCPVAYARFYSPRQEKTITRGSLSA